jgi:hypothetical protein
MLISPNFVMPPMHAYSVLRSRKLLREFPSHVSRSLARMHTSKAADKQRWLLSTKASKDEVGVSRNEHP